VEVSQEPEDEKGRGAKGKGKSYFWLLSRKSNLRSLTPKELQMHGRQHTGVSIYEARTGTREKDERSCWNDGEAAVEMVDGEIRIRQREQERRKSKEGGCCGKSFNERELTDHGYDLPSLTHHPRAKTRIFYP